MAEYRDYTEKNPLFILPQRSTAIKSHGMIPSKDAAHTAGRTKIRPSVCRYRTPRTNSPTSSCSGQFRTTHNERPANFRPPENCSWPTSMKANPCSIACQDTEPAGMTRTTQERTPCQEIETAVKARSSVPTTKADRNKRRNHDCGQPLLAEPKRSDHPRHITFKADAGRDY